MNHEERRSRQRETTVTVDGHDLTVAVDDSEADSEAVGEVVELGDACPVVVENRTERYLEDLGAFRSETHSMEGGE